MEAAYHSVQEIAEKGITHPFYSKKFPQGTQSATGSDLLSKYPLLTKADLLEGLEEAKKRDPEGFYKAVYITSSGGTTGNPLYIFTDVRENVFQRAELAKAFVAFDIFNDSTIALILHGNVPALYRSCEIFMEFVVRANGTAIPYGALTSDEEILTAVQTFRVNTLTGTTSRLLAFAEYVSHNGLSVKISKIVYTSETMFPNTANFIIKALGVENFCSVFGSAEAGIWGIGPSFLPLGSFVYDTSMIQLEVLPESNQDQAEEPEAEHGKLVITNLIRYRNPIIRFDCGDVGKTEDYPVPEPYRERLFQSFGYHKSFKVMSFKGRGSHSFFFGGSFLNLCHFEEILKDSTVLEFQIVLNKDQLAADPKEELELRVVLQDETQIEKIHQRLKDLLETNLMSGPTKVVSCSSNDLEKVTNSRKVKKIVDNRRHQ